MNSNYFNSNTLYESWFASSLILRKLLLLLLLLLLLKKIGSARLRESDIHPISRKTSAPHYQPIDRKK